MKVRATFVARTEELVQKTMCEHVCDPTSEEEEVAVQKACEKCLRSPGGDSGALMP